VKPMEDDPSENARSVGFLLQFGKFRFVDLADMTWNTELGMVCPNNKVGAADLFLVSHHGASVSNSPALLAALGPRVAVMNNGARKGGDKATFERFRALAGFEDLWQLHYSISAGDANGSEPLIANLEQKCEGRGIDVVANKDGSFRVTNRRNGTSKAYPPRKG
jgi:competence protein ComEC